MKESGRGSGRIGRQGLLVVAVVALVALAGCSAIVPGSEDTAGNESDAGDGDSSTPSPGDIISSAAESTASVDSYRTSADWELTISSANAERSSEATVNTSVDRETQRLKMVQEATGPAGTVTSETYVVNGSLYQYSSQLSRTFGSNWVKVDISGNFTERFRQNDELGSHRVMLENASVTVNGTEEIDGTEAYRLEADVNETELNEYYGYADTEIGIDNVSTTVWVATESNRVLRADGVISQKATLQGQTTSTSIDYDVRFEYTDVDVELPENASSAKPIDQDPSRVS